MREEHARQRRGRGRPRARVLLGLACWLALAVPAPVGAQPSPSPVPSSSDPNPPAPSLSALAPVEEPLFGIRSVVPEGWSSLGQGIHARGAPPVDPVLLALQSTPGAPEAVWPALLPQLLLTEVPEPTGVRSTPAFEWSLYTIPVAAPTGAVVIELAVAQREGRTYLVLLQAGEVEVASLRESVFLPAVEAFDLLAPEPTTDPSTLPYVVEEVTFEGGTEGVTLAGSLSRPRTTDRVPAVILLSGSGPQDRDESLAPLSAIKPFALLADALTRAGVAVLRYDDRGVGGSSGDHASATVDDLAGDGRAAIDYLAGRDDIDPARIGLLGHSEGGVYAAALAAVDPRVAFVVGLAPPAVDGVALLGAQYEALARAQGLPAADIEGARRFAERVFPAVLAGDEALAREIVAEEVGSGYDRQPEATRTALGERQAFIDQQVAAQLPSLTSVWFRSLLASDAGADWRRVSVPVLGVFGGRDVQVVASQNEPALREALVAAGNAHGETVVLPFANHLFQSSVSGAPAEYASLPAEFTPELLPLLSDWVARQAGVASGG